MVHNRKDDMTFALLKQIFDRSNDPVYGCNLYQDKDAGSCTHVDGLLCDFPRCSMLSKYQQKKEDIKVLQDRVQELLKVLELIANAETYDLDLTYCQRISSGAIAKIKGESQ